MATLKSKQFKKKYAASMDNVPEKGVWSGRGIGIPIGGAMGGGDDYKQKIGHGKLPDFRTGRPTQGADSTFSSYLARVNTGYDDVYLDIPMFPEQEAEDEDIYYGDEPSPIRSRKLPKDFKIKRPKIQGIREMTFKDDNIVSDSRYSLLSVFNEGDETVDEGLAQAAVKLVPAALKSAGMAIPYVDIVLGTALLGWSMSKIKGASDSLVTMIAVPENQFVAALTSDNEQQWQDIMALVTVENTDPIKEEFDNFLSQLKSIILTLIQTVDSVGTTAAGFAGPQAAVPEELVTVPAANIATGIAGFFGEMIPIERWLFDMATKGAGYLEKYSEWIRSLRPETVQKYMSKLEEGGGILRAVIFYPDRAFRRLGEFYRALHNPEELTPGDVVVQGTLDKISNETGVELPSELRQAIAQTGGEQMSLEELRNFIRESVYPDYPSYHAAQPTGFEYRSVPVVISKEDADSDFETLDDYDEFAVAYKTDGGVVAYQDRNKLVKEAALRSIIRRKIKSIISENKKKENY